MLVAPGLARRQPGRWLARPCGRPRQRAACRRPIMRRRLHNSRRALRLRRPTRGGAAFHRPPGRLLPLGWLPSVFTHSYNFSHPMPPREQTVVAGVSPTQCKHFQSAVWEHSLLSRKEGRRGSWAAQLSSSRHKVIQARVPWWQLQQHHSLMRPRPSASVGARISHCSRGQECMPPCSPPPPACSRLPRRLRLWRPLCGPFSPPAAAPSAGASVLTLGEGARRTWLKLLPAELPCPAPGAHSSAAKRGLESISP
jgi:hypothetical protein